MNLETNLKKYAQLVVEAGVGLKKGQIAVIRTPIECAPFARAIAKAAYEMGAKEVVVSWSDEELTRMKYDYCDLMVFEEHPRWQAVLHNDYAKQDACFISIAANDPDLLKGVDPKKIVAANKSARVACEVFYKRIDCGELVWNIVSAPTQAWAKKVFPDCSPEQAVEKLWNAIFKAVRVDTENPVDAWKKHKQSFEEKKELLNKKQFTSLHIKNSLGTDLTVAMPKNHIWQGGGDTTVGGTDFFPNMPTEEVFCAPQATGVNGVVYSSMPLNYGGNLIEDFSFTFKDGVIVSHTAKVGYDILEEILKTDGGARRLGEIALVPFHSPISMMNILFYNTLYDENASCHLALGAAYQSCVEGGLSMDKEQLEKAGMNDSVIHIDFMFGTEDLSITGIDESGEKTVLFTNGDWTV